MAWGFSRDAGGIATLTTRIANKKRYHKITTRSVLRSEEDVHTGDGTAKTHHT